jgi:hypothetical protein
MHKKINMATAVITIDTRRINEEGKMLKDYEFATPEFRMARDFWFLISFCVVLIRD